MATGRLEGRIAWISGAARGIGEGTAKLFAEKGAAVAVVDRDEAGGARVADEIRSGGGQAEFVRCDVTDEEQVRRSIERTVAAFGGLQILVNNAGIVDIRMLHECTQEQWTHVMAVNVRSIFFALKHAFPHLRKNVPRNEMLRQLNRFPAAMSRQKFRERPLL